MFKTIALTTALTVFATLPANSAAAADGARLLMEEHYSEAGYEVDLYVTRGAVGGLLSEATLTDPATGEAVDVWTDGTTVWWDGVIDGERVNGSMPTSDGSIEDPSPPPQPFCFTPVTAIICLGAVVVLAGFEGCKTFCIPDGGTEVPGGQGGVPPEEPSGGGDSDGDGKTGGSDED